LASGGIAASQGQTHTTVGPPTVTVCQFFQNPLGYNDRVIGIRGKWRLGEDSITVYDNGCAQPCTTSNASLPWEPRVLTWPCAVNLDLESLPKRALDTALLTADQANGGRTETEILATFTGRLRMKENYYDVLAGGPFPNGFGLFNVHAAQMIVENVLDVDVEPRAGEAGPLKPLTVCEVLGDIQRYKGKPLAIIGVMVSNGEAGGLTDGGCGQLLVTGEHHWANYITEQWNSRFAPSPPAEFQLDPGTTTEKSARVKAHTPLTVRKGFRGREYVDRLEVVYGRFETRERFVEVHFHDGVHGNGFGHLGFAPAQLLIAGEDSIKVLEVAKTDP
jgi:hypothetical protein